MTTTTTGSTAPPARSFSTETKTVIDQVLQQSADEQAPMKHPLTPGYRVRLAVAEDIPSLIHLTRALAEYEREPESVKITPETLLRDGFGAQPLFYVLLIEKQMEGGDGVSSWEAVGSATFCFMYSTWEGRVMFLEDLFIMEKDRRRGLGKHTLQLLARISYHLDCSRFQWMALNWNTPALTFYDKIGATQLPTWLTLRMYRDEIRDFATS